MKSQKVIFQKLQKLLTENLNERLPKVAIHSISMAGYVTAVPAIVHGKLQAQEPSSFCDFGKMTSCDFQKKTMWVNFVTKSAWNT